MPSPCCSTLETWLDAATLKALGDPSRAGLVLQLAGSCGPRTVTDLAAHSPLDVSVVSRHLKVLRELGVVQAERQGREVYHRLDCGDLVLMLRNLADALEACCPTPSAGRRTGRKETP